MKRAVFSLLLPAMAILAGCVNSSSNDFSSPVLSDDSAEPISASSQAEATGVISVDSFLIYYSCSSTDCTISRVVGEGEKLDIPESIEGRPVTAIVPDLPLLSAFKDAKAKCIQLPKSVATIGLGAFAYSDVEEIILNDGLLRIDDLCFNYCQKLTSLVLPDSVEKVGSSVFDGCSSLAFIHIGAKTAFEELKIFSLINPFASCVSLRSITVAKENSNYESIDGSLYSHGAKELYWLSPELNDGIYTMPVSLEKLGPACFAAAAHVRKIVFSTAFEPTIEPFGADWTWELARLPLLMEVDIPTGNPYMMLDGRTICSKDGKILWRVLRGESIHELELPNVEKVGGYAFWDNQSISKVLFSSGVELGDPSYYSNTSIEIGFISESEKYTVDDQFVYDGGKIFWVNGTHPSISIKDGSKLFTSAALANLSVEEIAIEEPGVFYSFDGAVYKNETEAGEEHHTLWHYPCAKRQTFYVCKEGTNDIDSSALSFNKYLQKIVISTYFPGHLFTFREYCDVALEGIFVVITPPLTLVGSPVPIYYFSEEQPDPNDHEKWHYVDGEPVVW